MAGAILTFLGLALVLGWNKAPLALAVAVTALGTCVIGVGGYLVRDKTANALGTTSLATLLSAYLVATRVPLMVDAGSGSDALMLWTLMASGTLLFFGLSLLIGAGFSLLLTKG